MRLLTRAILLATTVALPAYAQTPEVPATVLPDRVVTATRVPTLADQIPAGVTVIDRATIEQRGYTTLVDALQAVPGLRVVQSGGLGGNASAFIRGTNSNHVLVLRDGLPVNDPSDPGGLFNFGVDTLGDVERIEVVRGPMSSLYGSGAIGGVINLISRRGMGKPHGTVELAGGLPRAVLGRADVSGSEGMFDYSAALESRSDRGFDTTPRREKVYTGARNGFRGSTASVNLGFTPVENLRFSALLRGRQSVFGLDELGFPAYDARAYTGRDATLNGRIGAAATMFDGVWESGLFLGGTSSDRKYTELLEAADPNQSSGDTRYHGRRADLQWNNTVRLPDLGPVTAAALTAGYEHIADSAHSSLNTAGSGFGFQSNVRASSHSDAGHVGVQGQVFQRVTLTGDIREEAARYGGDAFTYRFGAVVAVPEVWSRFKASYGTAFRAPSLFDLFGVDSFGFKGNPGLRPERSRGYEAGWAVDLPVFGAARGATFEATYFNNRIRDLITNVFVPVDTLVNIARAKTQGVEASLTLRPASWLETTATYTYTDARNATTNARLLRRPRNQASLNLRATPLPKLSIAPEIVYTSAFQDFLTDDSGFPTTVGRSKGGLIFNLTATYQILPSVTLFADGRNLGNSRFEPANGFQTPGPSFLAGTRVKF